MSKHLLEFWSEVFGYVRGSTRPMLEDHFTLLDLAANSGHHLGMHYSPKKLRAIRRMSIHRIFDILDSTFELKPEIATYLSQLVENYDVTVISTNWDIVVEQLMIRVGKRFRYGIDVHDLNHAGVFGNDLTLLKMHGSSNWMYCDSCRRLYCGLDEKTALWRKAFLEADDFEILGTEPGLLGALNPHTDLRTCDFCYNRLAGRVATFSYRKAFSINQFQTIWDRAHQALSEADQWLMVGYSLPEADFELRHLIKSAQLGKSVDSDLGITTVLKKDSKAQMRYESFFGRTGKKVFQDGFGAWIDGGGTL